MPFKSEKQRKWMWANDPEMAKKWEKKEKKMKETKVRKLIRKMVREIMSEAFGGELSNSEKKKFEKVRKEQSEVLGYKLTGKSDIKEGKITESRVAKTILQQLGGNKFIAMTGAKNLGASNKSLSMKIGRNSKSINYVVITLKSSDLYDVEFIRIRGAKRTVVKKLKGVYADQLQTMFTKYTGMRTSL